MLGQIFSCSTRGNLTSPCVYMAGEGRGESSLDGFCFKHSWKQGSHNSDHDIRFQNIGFVKTRTFSDDIKSIEFWQCRWSDIVGHKWGIKTIKLCLWPPVRFLTDLSMRLLVLLSRLSCYNVWRAHSFTLCCFRSRSIATWLLIRALYFDKGIVYCTVLKLGMFCSCDIGISQVGWALARREPCDKSPVIRALAW